MLKKQIPEKQFLIEKKIFSDLLAPLFDELNSEMNDEYCVIGNYDDLPNYTENDVDIWVANEKKFLKILKKVCILNKYRIYLLNFGYSGFNVYIVKTGFELCTPVHLDIMTSVNLTPFYKIIDSKTIRSSIERFRGFNILSKNVELFGHFMYPLINKGFVKQKYKSELTNLSGNRAFVALLESSLGCKQASLIAHRISKGDWDEIDLMSSDIKKKLFISTLLKDSYRIPVGIMKMIIRMLRRLVYPSGIFVVFLGVDGSGKTTTINSLDGFFNNYFLPGKCKKFYWRPFLLPRISKLLGNKYVPKSEKYNSDGTRVVKKNLPRRVLDVCKLIYYVIDFFIGRIKYQSEYSRGGIIVFDRYFYDNIIYAQRFGFYAPQFLMKLLNYLIPKPDLIFYLSSNPDVLYERKKEINVDQIIEQQSKYDDFLFNFDNVVYVDTSDAPAATHDSIVKSCVLYMTDRLGGKFDFFR